MSEKVKVSREVAEVIGFVKETLFPNGTHWNVVRDHTLSQAGFCTEELQPLNKISLDTLIRALYIGYEVEQTPTEQAIQWCVKRNCIAPGYSPHDVVMAVKSILERTRK